MARIVRDSRLTPGSRQARDARRVILRPVGRSHAATTPPVDWSTRAAHATKALTVTLLPIAALLVWAWFLGAEKRAIMGLTEDQRKTAYATALHAFEVMCAAPVAGLEEPCRAQARLLSSFPDCNEQCRHLAGSYTGPGRRPQAAQPASARQV